MSWSSEHDAEWLEADGRGGFASGTASGVRRRRYHALLLTATNPPGGRVVLVNGLDAWATTAAGRFPLSTQWYAPGVQHPDGVRYLSAFTAEPWPAWTYALPDGTRIRHECFVRYGLGAVVLSWTLLASPPAGSAPGVSLEVRPLLSGRDPHALHHENGAIAATPAEDDGWLVWRTYPDVPAIALLANGRYAHAPDWYRQFLYTEEAARGLDAVEDLLAPGFVRWTLAATPGAVPDAVDAAVCVFAAGGPVPRQGAPAARIAAEWRATEAARRAAFASPLDRAADAYVTRRGQGDERTIVAGYPWFTDWGRDTFIALRGVCLATGRFDDALRILRSWAPLVSDGMLPNRFPEGSDAPEYNSVDAALWYVIAVHELLAATRVGCDDARTLHAAVDAILDGYARGTRFGIRLDDDGLLAAGAPGVQLTWMDAKVGEWVVTPRIGKPVEVQGLWLNALRLVAPRVPRWAAVAQRGLAAFRERFVRPDGRGLYDVVDVDHRPGTADDAVRPNQIFAVGGLPARLVEDETARGVVAVVEETLWTPLGLRSLAPGSPGYAPRYQGGVRERDGAYHQGTVWPWLLGAFVEAWVRVRGNTADVRRVARERFVAPVLAHLAEAGLGHVSEIADADAPHTPRGCPFQAWSVGELLRLDRVIAPAERAAVRG